MIAIKSQEFALALLYLRKQVVPAAVANDRRDM